MKTVTTTRINEYIDEMVTVMNRVIRHTFTTVLKWYPDHYKSFLVVVTN